VVRKQREGDEWKIYGIGDSCEWRDEGEEITGKWQYRKDSRIVPYRRPVRPLSCLVEF
jgi:hypothetical protein